MHSQTRRLFNSVNYVSLAVHGTFNKLVSTRFKRLALLQIATGSFVKTLICWIAVLKMKKKHISGLELWRHYMSVGELKEKQQTQQNAKKPKPKQKKQTQRSTPLKSKQLFTKSPFQNHTLPCSILLPQTPVVACVAPAHCERRPPSFGLLMGIPFTCLRFPASQYVPLDLGLDTSCCNSAYACSRHL